MSSPPRDGRVTEGGGGSIAPAVTLSPLVVGGGKADLTWPEGGGGIDARTNFDSLLVLLALNDGTAGVTKVSVDLRTVLGGGIAENIGTAGAAGFISLGGCFPTSLGSGTGSADWGGATAGAVFTGSIIMSSKAGLTMFSSFCNRASSKSSSFNESFKSLTSSFFRDKFVADMKASKASSDFACAAASKGEREGRGKGRYK
jgi:hypothetical protein